jgi:predicted aspartyl protease
MLAQQQQLNLIAHARCFITLVKINGRRFIAMIDSGAIGNFMTRAFVKKKGYSTQKKPDAYNLVIVDENSLFDENERVNKETKSLPIAI